MTKAARNALAYLHVYGSMPSGIHHPTWIEVYKLTITVDYMKTGRLYNVKPEYVAECEAHPMVATVRRLESEGWQVYNAHQKRKIGRGIGLRKEIDGRFRETSVRANGKQGMIF